jgi:hypothetical protein
MVAFKKYQVDACVMTDPTHARVECVKCIDTQMEAQISKNVITGVTLPSGFIPQDYSKEIAELRMHRKIAALTKQSRKAKCVKSDDDDDSCDEDDDDTRKPLAVKKSRKAKRVAVDTSDDGDGDGVLVRPAKALRKATSVNKSGKVVARATTGGKGKSVVSALASSESEEAESPEVAAGEVAGVASGGVASVDSESSDSDVSEGKPDEVNKGEVKSGEVES